MVGRHISHDAGPYTQHKALADDTKSRVSVGLDGYVTEIQAEKLLSLRLGRPFCTY